jgi:integrase
LFIAPEIDYPKVRTFLESVARNSKNSKASYETGLKHFQRFLGSSSTYKDCNIESILTALQAGSANVYELLDGFVSYLMLLSQQPPIAPTTVSLYTYALRSYVQYHDIDVNPAKFRRRVRLPKVAREDEEALDANDIRKILLACNNRRLKAYLLVLASGGMRASEALAMRYKDIDFTASPARIHIRKEYTKTKTARDIYISEEATAFLKQWLGWKYSKERVLRTGKRTTITPMPDDLVFSPFIGSNPNSIYHKIILEFRKLLEVVGLAERKENSLRRKITLHSFRRHAKSVISDAVNQDYSEWFLGHRKSPYYVKKQNELSEIYRTKCMRHLTFLDYSAIELTGKEIEARLEEKEREIDRLGKLNILNTDAIRTLSDRLIQLENRFANLTK